MRGGHPASGEGDMIASAARAWRTEGPSAVFALIRNNLRHVGRRVMKDRSDGNHWQAAVVAHRRWKLEDEVTKRIDRHSRLNARHRRWKLEDEVTKRIDRHSRLNARHTTNHITRS